MYSSTAFKPSWFFPFDRIPYIRDINLSALFTCMQTDQTGNPLGAKQSALLASQGETGMPKPDQRQESLYPSANTE